MYYEIFSSKDRKIMMWDKESIDDLVGCFTMDEYYEMQDYLYEHGEINEEARHSDPLEDYGFLVFAYMQCRFHVLIDIGQQKEIRAFFEALMEWYTEDSYASQLDHKRLIREQIEKRYGLKLQNRYDN